MIEVVKCSKCLVLPEITRQHSNVIDERYYSQIKCRICGKMVGSMAKGALATQKDADEMAIKKWNSEQHLH